MAQEKMSSVSQEDFDNARQTFSRMSTNRVSSSEHEPLFFQTIRIVETVRLLDENSGLWSNDSLEAEMRKDVLLTFAIDHFNLFLNSARDALITVFALVGEANVLPTLSLSTLIRQGLESAASALYLMDISNLDCVRIRGFAISCMNLREQNRFATLAREAGFSSEEQLTTIEDRNRQKLLELLEIGEQYDLIEESQGSIKPRTPWPSKSELLGSVSLPIGNWDFRLLYSMLSGHSHGLSWAQIGGSRVTPIADHLVVSSGTPQYAGHSLNFFEPNTANTAFGLRVTQDMLKRCVHVRQVLNGSADRQEQ